MIKAKYLVIIMLMFVFLNCSKKDDNQKKDLEVVIPVEIATVKESNIQRSLELVGTLTAWKEANLGAQNTARVQKIYVDQGSRVKEGDILFEMDDTQLAQAKIQYQITKDNYIRLEPLFESGSISQSQFDQVKAAYETSEKTYQLLLTNTQFKAPFSGVITSKKLNDGEIFMLSPGGVGAPAIVTLMQLNPLKIILNVSEKNLREINLNQPVEIKSDVYPNEKFRGTVSKINQAINSVSRTFDVEVKIPNPSEKLKPGMFVRAKILTGFTNGLIIPRSSALKQLGTASYYGFIIKDRIAQRVDLILGQEFDSEVEILSGLSANDKIVTRGQGLLKNGSKIEIKSNMK